MTLPELISPLDDLSYLRVPDASSAQSLSLLYQLEHSQWLPKAVIEQKSFGQIRRVFQYALAQVPLYQKLYEGLFERNDDLTMEQFSQLPILKRAFVQAENEIFLSQRVPKAHQPVRVHRSSGSTGQPISFYSSAVTQAFWRVFTLREHAWHQRDFSRKLAQIQVVSERTSVQRQAEFSNWGIVTQGLYRTGALVFMDVTVSLGEQVEWIKRHAPDYLLSYPSHISALADFCEVKQIKLPALLEVRTVGETVTSALREKVRALWGVKIVDTYSSEETGCIAIQCPQCDHYHVQSENVWVEILNDDDKPCVPGEAGRVVVTTLNNFASPFIRYELGDYAVAGEDCECGRGLPVIEKILGRSRNRLQLPDGSSQFLEFGDRAVYRSIVSNIVKYQFVQKSRELVKCLMVTDGAPLTDLQKTQLREYIESVLGHGIRVDVIACDDISCGKNGKFEEFISEVC